MKTTCMTNKGTHNWEHIGTSGNPYEGGTSFSKCSICGIVKGTSEDGTQYYDKTYKPHFRTIQDDMRKAGISDVNNVENQIAFLDGNI
jgi:cytochrome c2